MTFFYGAAVSNAAEQANVVRSDINVQPADGFVVAVKGACKRIGVCANERPRGEVGAGVQFALFV